METSEGGPAVLQTVSNGDRVHVLVGFGLPPLSHPVGVGVG